MSALVELGRWSFSLGDLQNVAEAVGQMLPESGVVAVHGDMGAGKTTMIRQLLSVWHVDEEGASPTFGLVHHHRVKRTGVGFMKSATWICIGWKTRRRQSGRALPKC